MDTYLYLLLSVLFILPVAPIYYARPDLREKILRAGIIGGFAGILSEFWHLKDYWQPATTIGLGVMSPEDVILGFADCTLAVALYDVFLRTKDVPGERPRPRTFWTLVLCGIVILVLFNNILGFNSLIVSMVAFVMATVIMVILRPDLLRPSLLSGLFFGGFAALVYIPLFLWVAPDYWDNHWRLVGTPYDVRFLRIPLTEYAWYFLWGLLAGVIPNFARGTVKKPI